MKCFENLILLRFEGYSKLCILFFLVLNCGSLYAETLYVAVNGSDANNGSKENPFATIEYAVAKLADGDVLQLREGVYYETNIIIKDLSNILISAYPGENVEISGGIPDFRQTPNTKWELCDPTINLYKSVDTYPTASYMNGWLLEDDLHLIEYENMNNLTSTNYGAVHGTDPLYQGPGILHSSDGHLYIRLGNNPNDLIDPLGNPISPKPADVNPNNHSISVFFTQTLIKPSNCSNIKFKNIRISHAQYLFDISTGTTGFDFYKCRFDYGRYAFVLRDNGAENYEIHECEFNNGLPQYVYWTDVKNRPEEIHEPYPEFQSTAINGPMTGWNIHHNLFRDGFDAFHINEGTQDLSIKNNEFVRFRDDAMELRLVSNVEIAYNLFWKVGEGVSCDFNGSTQTDGSVYIHHNIIDVSHYQHGGRKGNYRESDWPVWQIIDAFGSHGDTYPAKWKVYNNTILLRKSGYDYNPSEISGKVEANPDFYVYNNIFFVFDDRVIFRGRSFDSGAHYDGNVVYRMLDTTYHAVNPSKFPMYHDFGADGRYSHLADFRGGNSNNPAWSNWEENGLEVDPQFNVDSIVNGAFAGEDTWKRYISSNCKIFTEGALYSGLNWPGITGVDYRGAIKDSPFTNDD